MVSAYRHARDWRAYLSRGGSVLRKRRWEIIGYGSIGIFGLWLFASSDPFQKCEHERKDRPSYQQLHERSFSIVGGFRRLELHSSCVLSDEGVLGVLSGVAVAFFTFTLWRSTHLLWRSAESQRTADAAVRQQEAADMAASIAQAARAAEAMERLATATAASAEAIRISADASMGVELPRLELVSVLRGSGKIEDDLRVSAITLVFKNFGRTTAHMVECGIEYIIGDFLPEKFGVSFTNTRTYLLGTICEPQDSSNLRFNGIIDINSEDAKRVSDENFWFYGFVAYRDFLGGHWLTKFCLRVNVSTDGPGFVPSQMYADYYGRERYDPAKPMHIDSSLEDILGHRRT